MRCTVSEAEGAARLMPWPASYQATEAAALPPQTGFEPRFAAVRSGRLDRACERLAAARGAPRQAPWQAPRIPLIISCDQAAEALPQLDDDESYRLQVSADGVTVQAPTEWGVLRALATLTQLGAGGAPIAACRIDDAPRYPWRGLMLDVARHFLPLPDLLRTLDGMAVVKLNVLHLHLADDQGFRFPSQAYPKLPGAEHFTRDELHELVAAAADRGIRVVPELDVPGHTACWLEAYPEWGNRPAEPSRKFGGHRECLDPTRPAVHEALGRLFAELAEVFPDPYVHIGGDEVQSGWWDGDERIRAYMDQHGLADAAALQAHFNRDLVALLDGLGKRTLGWDEVLHGDLPAGITVQAWRGAAARQRVLDAGFDCVLSSPYYLDLFFPADVHHGFDPGAPEAELLSREDAMLSDPRLAHVAGGMAWSLQWRDLDPLPAAAAPGRLLGGEGCLWAELVTSQVLDVRLWSRLPALAERFWSSRLPEPPALRRRLAVVLEDLKASAGVDVPGTVRRLVEAAGVSPHWWPLIRMLEPVKWYARLLGEDALAARLAGRDMPKARPYDLDSPLDRVVDALPPEGLGVAQLADLLDRLPADPAAQTELAALTDDWRRLPEAGGPAELAAPAAALRELGDLTAAWLDGRISGHLLRDTLPRLSAPMGEYLLAPAILLASHLDARTGS